MHWDWPEHTYIQTPPQHACGGFCVYSCFWTSCSVGLKWSGLSCCWSSQPTRGCRLMPLNTGCRSLPNHFHFTPPLKPHRYKRPKPTSPSLPQGIPPLLSHLAFPFAILQDTRRGKGGRERGLPLLYPRRPVLAVPSTTSTTRAGGGRCLLRS